MGQAAKTQDRGDGAKTELTPIRAGIYVRVSGEELRKIGGKKEERQSVQGQRADGIRFAEHRGWAYEVFDKDSEISGAKGRDSRRDLDRLLKQIAAGRIQVIVVRDVWRLVRSPRVLVQVRDVLEKTGAYILTFDGQDSRTRDGRLMMGIMADVGEHFVEYASERSRAGKERAARSGTLNLNGYCLGYRTVDRGVIEVDEAASEVVREIFRSYAHGKLGMNQIAKRLTDRGVRGPNGGYLGYAHVRNIIRNPRYVGKIPYKGEVLPSKVFTPIVDEDLWRIANHRLEKAPTKGGQGERRLLSGTLVCGYCWQAGGHNGGKYVHMAGVAHSDPKCSHYRCNASKYLGKRACKGWDADGSPGGSIIMQDDVETFVSTLVGGMSFDAFRRLSGRMNGNTPALEAERNRLETEAEAIAVRRDDLAGAFAEGGMDAKSYAVASRALDDKEKAIRSSISEVIGAIASGTTEDARLTYSDLIKGFIGLSLEDKRRAVREVIERILVFKQRIVVYFKLRTVEDQLMWMDFPRKSTNRRYCPRVMQGIDPEGLSQFIAEYVAKVDSLAQSLPKPNHLHLVERKER